MREYKLTDEQRNEVLAMIEHDDPRKVFTYSTKRFLRLLNEAVNKYRDEDSEISPEDIKHVFGTAIYHLGDLIAHGCTVKIKGLGKFVPEYERNEDCGDTVTVAVDFRPSGNIFDEMGASYWFRMNMLENYAKHEKLFAYAD